MVKIFETLDNAQGLRFTPIAPPTTFLKQTPTNPQAQPQRAKGGKATQTKPL